jgi:hypothetical protein
VKNKHDEGQSNEWSGIPQLLKLNDARYNEGLPHELPGAALVFAAQRKPDACAAFFFSCCGIRRPPSKLPLHF